MSFFLCLVANVNENVSVNACEYENGNEIEFVVVLQLLVEGRVCCLNFVSLSSRVMDVVEEQDRILLLSR